jgi:hypothetical protein
VPASVDVLGLAIPSAIVAVNSLATDHGIGHRRSRTKVGIAAGFQLKYEVRRGWPKSAFAGSRVEVRVSNGDNASGKASHRDGLWGVSGPGVKFVTEEPHEVH